MSGPRKYGLRFMKAVRPFIGLASGELSIPYQQIECITCGTVASKFELVGHL